MSSWKTFSVSQSCLLSDSETTKKICEAPFLQHRNGALIFAYVIVKIMTNRLEQVWPTHVLASFISIDGVVKRPANLGVQDLDAFRRDFRCCSLKELVRLGVTCTFFLYILRSDGYWLHLLLVPVCVLVPLATHLLGRWHCIATRLPLRSFPYSKMTCLRSLSLCPVSTLTNERQSLPVSSKWMFGGCLLRCYYWFVSLRVPEDLRIGYLLVQLLCWLWGVLETGAMKAYFRFYARRSDRRPTTCSAVDS